MPDNVDKLFEIMQANGAANDRNKFRKVFLTPGNKGYKIRKDIYDGLRADSIIDSPTYEDFRRKLRLGGTPTVNKYRQQMFNSVDPTKNKASELTRKAVKTAHKAMNNVRKPVRGAVVNKQGKKVSEFDITPAKTLDDLNREYAQEVTNDWEKEQQRQSLYNTTRSLDEVQRKIAERDAQLDEADNGFWTGIRHAAQGMNVTGGMFQQYDDDIRKELIDPKYKQYLVEANYLTQMKKQLIQEEEDAAAPNATKWDRFKHASSSFTSGMLDEAFGSDAFDFGGYNKIRESDVLLRISDRINRGVATDDDRRLLQILKDKEEIESRLDNDAYSFGRGASQSAGFVTDFLITGGGDFGGLGRLGGKMALGLARKTFAKTMTKDLGKRFAAWSLKNLGKTLGEATGAAMTATSVQVGKTAANATQRYLGLDSEDGGLEYDKDGNLKFKGGTDAGTAIAKAIASGTIENYTELLGPHITSMGKRLFGWAGVGLEKITPDALSKFFDKVGSSELFKRIGTFTDEIANSKVLNAGKKALANVGVNDMPEEGLEEEAGIILNSLITGDNKFSDLWDKETQYKTWGGVMSMMGAMRAIPIAHSAVGTVYSASKNKVEYFKCKHDLTKAETLARQALGDKWTPIKELIDNADNKHIIEVGVNIIRQSDKYSQEQAKAAENYIGQLLKMRGFNNATMASIRDKNAKGEEQTDADKRDIEVSNAYAEGHEAEGEFRHMIQLEYEKRKANLAKRLGLTPEKIEAMNVGSFSSYSGLYSDADFDIFQYKKAKAAYDGVMDNAQNLVDIAGEVAAQRVDNMTNVHDGTIRKALKKGTEMNPDSPVYIISGNIVLNDDGSINYTDSDKMIVIYDEETGQREAIGNFMLASVDPNMQNAEEVKAQAIIEAKQKIITEQSNVIDGVLVEGSEFTMEGNDGISHNYNIVQVDEQGNCIVSVDGTVLPEPLSLDAIQQQYDQSNVARSVKNDQTTQEPEQAAQEPEQTQQESQPIEDKFDYGKITNENDGNVKSVVVTDEEGKNRFPNAKAVFLIQDQGAMPKFVVMDEEGNLTSFVGKRGDKIQLSGEMTVDDYKKQRQEELQMIAAENANSSMIEDNSGENRGEIEAETPAIEDAEPIGTGVFGNIYNQFKGKVKEAFNFLMHHKSGDLLGVFHRDDVGDIDLVWGDENMGLAHILGKHVGEGKDFETPDDAVNMIENVINNGSIMQETPNRYVVTLDGFRVGIRKEFDGEKKNWIVTAIDYNRSKEEKGIVTNPTSASHGVEGSELAAPNDSNGKDINNSSNGNENNESLTFEDGTPIPVDESGETDLSQTDAAHAAEWYDNNLGEDADVWLDGEIKKAKKVLEQAKSRKLTGTKPSELVASKKEKEAAIADAQAHYDSAISIRDSLKERRIAKEENTPEGRKNLIDKARRKFARLKSAVNNDAEAVDQLYKETVGTLLHRLYDVTGIDVTDTIPLTAEEYVASNLGAHSLNYEGTETSKGVKQETGLSREDFAKTQLLAADGKGTTIDALVHSLWDNRPSNLESLDTQDIRNALIDVLTSGFKASEARSYIENIRIAQAEKLLEEQELAAENAAYAEQQKAKEEEKKKAEEENEKINEQTNENINAPEQNKFPDRLKEGSKTIEVPEDATEEKPLGEQRTDSLFSARKNGKQQTEAERAADVEKNKVDDVGLVDAVIGEKIRKSFERIAKMMGAKIQYQRTDKLGNGWIQETKDADGNVHRTIFITLDSSITEGAQFIFGHEMTHQIKNLNPAAYNELTQLVLDTYGSDAFDKAVDETMQRYSDAGFSGRARDYYAEEVVADAVGEMIRDLNLAHTLAMKMSHPLLAAIHEILQKIKLAFFGTEYSDVTKNIIRSIEQAYVKTAKGEITNSETGEDVSFSLRQKPEPKKKGVGYKVFVLKDGKLYPPMVANPDGAATPVGVWLDADAAPIAGESKTGRPQVKQGGKGTQGGSGKLAYRPGWHLGVVPYAIQFNRKDADGNKTLFPKNFVFAEVEYAADVDYQEEARQEGINPSGKYQHSLAGLKHLPTDGYYMYRTNPNPETDPWVITGAMKVNRILTRAEQAELVKNAGREPQQIQEGDIVTDDVVNSINQEIAAAPKFSLKVYHGSGADFTEFDFDHMGEGAGSQVFGWGGYVTSSKKIGKSYATLMDNDPSKAYYRIQRSNGTRFAKKYPTLESFLHGDKQIAMNDKFTEQEKIDFYNEMKKLAEPYHNLYEVDIPDDNGSNYLDWDKPLSKNQQDAIREGLEHLGVGIKTLESKGQSLERTGENVYNSTLYIGLTGTEYDLPERTKGISKFLSSVGYTGIKYKAGRNFGGAEVGDTNYVIFKPEDMKITEHTKFSLRLKSAIDETETNPSDAQKESGNYKKGHIKFGGYDYTIENPKGSIRSGKDANGKEWKVTMHDTYGYIRGKYGKDGDHLDMFINDKADLDNWNGDVFVVDQVNPDGSFDEHKVMYGYDSMDDAEKAYLANYSKGWKGLGNITGASKDEFDKWLDASNRKLKPFADYAKVKFSQAQSVSEPRYSLKDEKTLAGVHNITEEKLRKALKLGGFANPSLAVIDTSKSGHDNFGEISFIAPSALLDKRTGKTAGTWITDAYTQRYPSVEREMSEKGSQKFRDWVDSLEYPSEAKAEIKRQAEDALSNNNAPAWELMYLKEKGIDIKEYDSRIDYRWKEIISDHPTAEDILNSMQTDPELNEKVTSLAKHAIIHPTWEKVSLEVRRKMYKETGVKASPINPQVRKQTKEIFERDYAPSLLNKNGTPKKSDVKKVVEQMVKEHNDTKKYDFYLSKVKASNYVHKNGLYDDFVKWQENKLDEFGTKNRIFRGYKNDGTRKYVPETLENVSKAMREDADGQTNGSEYTSFGSFIAKLASRVDSTDEMRANKDKLSSNKDKEEFYEKWESVYYDLAKSLYDDVFYGEQRLHDIVSQADPKKYAKKEYGITLSSSFMKKLDALKNAVQTELKSAYFETKYNRPLRLNEFAAAVVPDNLGDDVRKGIENAGLPMYDYDPNKEGDRSRAFNEAINSSDNIRFSLKSMMEKPEGWKQANKKTIHIAEAIERDPKFSLKKLDGTLIKAGTYFSGGGLVEEGLKGIIDPVIAVEYDEKISGVYRNNFGQHIVTADVRDVDPKELIKQIDGEVEYFHASPVCKNYSQAKSNHAEVELDKETAASTAEFINAIKPKVVTIENVKGYKDSEAMKIITDALDANGYTWDADVYNAADYGGYTNRERLIVRAVRDGKLPEKPKKMAHKSGWYEAVADIIPTLTEKKNGVAPWMDVRLKADGIDWRNIDKPLYVMGSAYADGKIPHAFADELLPTLRTKSGDVIVMPDGKVYRAMGRVLARVSGVSDDYKMPFSESLSHTIIGNGIPTQLTEHVIAPLVQNTLRPTSPEEGNTRFSLRGSTPYDKQMEEWMEKNHLEKGAVPMEKPIMKEGENIFDYANRMVEWTRNQNLWKTAPKQTGFQDALDKWKADNGLSPDAYPPVRPHRENYLTEIGYTEDLEEYNKKKELWKSAPKPKDFDLSVELEDMNKQLRNIRRAVLNQKNYDQRTVKAVSDLVRKMLNIGWGDGLSRGKVGNLLSAAKNATGSNDVKKYLDKAMGILAENYLNRLSTAYDNLINTKGARADQSGVIKMGSLDAKGQAFMSEYKKAINMDDKSLNTYIANIEEDSAKNEDNVEMNDYRLAGIQAAIMFKQQIGGNDADMAELQRQIGELKNKKDATKEDKDLLKSLEKKLFENKFDRITMYENLLNNIQRMVKESKGRAKEFREEIAEHKNEILHRANLDLEGVDSTYYDTTTAKKKFVNNDLQRAVFSSTYTFEQFLKFFGKKAANGEGRLYNYFHKLNQDALDEEQLYNEMNRNALDEKTKELFGKKKFMKLVGIDGKGMKEMDIEVTDYSNKKTGKRTIHLKQGQMLYIYLVNKETDGEMKLRAMGITEEDVVAIEENLDPRVKAMGEWLQDEYLPECQRRYQATHTKYFGAPMKEVENYFPLAINNRARNVKEDVNQDSDAMSQLAGTSTGAIVTRRVNVIPLDIENADAFEVAFNHLQEMEEWSAMLPFRQDINTLLSYTHFRNQVQNMSSVAYGSGKTLWDEFKQTAQIAAGTYKPKVNAGMMDSRIAAAMGGIAVAKISGRLWTAIKQSQSATVFLPECDFTRFVKNGVNPYGSWKWAMENIPDFRKRVENMTYGDVKLRQYLDELEKWHDWTKTISKIGMAPNILVDGITCAVGARSVYETEVNRLTKLGYPKEKAEEKAYYKAVAAYNKTQQSSGGMYLSPMQVDRTYASAALSLFKNANYAYGRMQIEACRGLARTYDFWGGKHKTTLIESMTRQIMEEDGLDENTARAIAKATYNRTFRQSIGRLINFATLVPVSWALYKVLPYLLTGDDDDKKKDMIEEAVLKGFATSLSDNYVIPFASNILNAGLKVEDGKPTFDPEVFRYQNLYINPATSDLANIYSMVGNQKWYSVVNKFGMLGVQSLIGFNPETVGALYQALSEADYDNGNTAKEWQIGILKAISAPEESIRELYMDELGLKSGDIKKIPLAELEKRYAERQINRDNLLSQIFMDAESFNGYVDKYQQSFEKKIKDKMDKWDEYDKKKADEFFDTTTDPKLKDMIAKKRTKDANAAADEQIAKEGLNQEKKGKKPIEEAYDAVKMSIDVAEDNAISTYNKVLNKRYAALNDEYNEQTDAMKYIFMSNHPNFKAYKDLESEYTNYGKKMKELKEKLVSADGYDAKQTILKQIRAEREKFSELQSKVR